MPGILYGPGTFQGSPGWWADQFTALTILVDLLQASIDGAATRAELDAEASTARTAEALKLAKAANLSDLANTGTARTNLGLGGAAVANVGTTAGTVAAGDDGRFGGETPWVVDISSWAGAPAASGGSWDYQENWPYYGGGLITNEVTEAQNDFIGYDVLLGAGTWTLEMLYRTYTSCGIVTIDLDGVVLGTFDMYGPLTPNIRGIITGIVVASSGKKRLSFRLLTKNVAAAAYLMYFIHAQLRRTA